MDLRLHLTPRPLILGSRPRPAIKQAELKSSFTLMLRQRSSCCQCHDSYLRSGEVWNMCPNNCLLCYLSNTNSNCHGWLVTFQKHNLPKKFPQPSRPKLRPDLLRPSAQFFVLKLSTRSRTIHKVPSLVYSILINYEYSNQLFMH